MTAPLSQDLRKRLVRASLSRRMVVGRPSFRKSGAPLVRGEAASHDHGGVSPLEDQSP